MHVVYFLRYIYVLQMWRNSTNPPVQVKKIAQMTGGNPSADHERTGQLSAFYLNIQKNKLELPPISNHY
jgi:hypothetical protein